MFRFLQTQIKNLFLATFLILTGCIATVLATAIALNPTMNRTAIIAVGYGAEATSIMHMFLWMLIMLIPQRITLVRGILVGLLAGIIIYPLAVRGLSTLLSQDGSHLAQIDINAYRSWLNAVTLASTLKSAGPVAIIYALANTILVTWLGRWINYLQTRQESTDSMITVAKE